MYATLTSLKINLALRNNVVEDFSEVHVAILTLEYGGLFMWIDNNLEEVYKLAANVQRVNSDDYEINNIDLLKISRILVDLDQI